MGFIHGCELYAIILGILIFIKELNTIREINREKKLSEIRINEARQLAEIQKDIDAELEKIKER